MFFAELFTKVKRQTQSKRPSEEWINKMWYTNTMGYYTAIERKEILIHTITWMSLESVTLSEISQTQKENFVIPLK